MKLSNILSKLPAYAMKSSICHQHGAVVIRNGSPIVYGFNEIKGNNTYHAEHDVIRRYLALYGLKDKQCLLRKEST